MGKKYYYSNLIKNTGKKIMLGYLHRLNLAHLN